MSLGLNFFRTRVVKKVRAVLMILIAVAAAAVVFEATRPYRAGNLLYDFVDGLVGRDIAVNDEEMPVYIELPEGAELDGLFVITLGRQNYKDGDMTLIIPSLDFSEPVSAGTSQGDLKGRPGIFEASGMPGEVGANVSIAGHRSHGMFYYLNRLGVDDRIQIVYNSFVYTYVFYEQAVVLPSDWSVISGQGFDCCTLITCTPIVEADKRLVVRFVLEDVSRYVSQESD